MPVQFYLSPMRQGLIARNPDIWTPRVYEYLSVGGYAMHGGSQAQKGVVFVVVSAPQDELDAIDADPLVRRIPVPYAALDTTFGELSADTQTAAIERLTALRVPTHWINANTPLRQIVRYLIGLLHLVGAGWLGNDFPEVDLDQTFSTLTATQRNRIRTWATNQGYSLSDVPNTTTVRTVLHALIVRYPRWPAAFVYTIAGEEIRI